MNYLKPIRKYCCIFNRLYLSFTSLGLEYLAQVDSFIIKQQVELLEAFTGFEGANRYEILNGIGQRVYLAVESK